MYSKKEAKIARKIFSDFWSYMFRNRRTINLDLLPVPLGPDFDAWLDNNTSNIVDFRKGDEKEGFYPNVAIGEEKMNSEKEYMVSQKGKVKECPHCNELMQYSITLFWKIDECHWSCPGCGFTEVEEAEIKAFCPFCAAELIISESERGHQIVCINGSCDVKPNIFVRKDSLGIVLDYLSEEK